MEKESQELEVDDDVIIIYGDATRDELLKKVGVERAKGLISVIDSDAQNLYVVLSAKGLNQNLFIISQGKRRRCRYYKEERGSNSSL
ncbi:MAG: NAD-binding protein [Candidatus Scalindua sp.]